MCPSSLAAAFIGRGGGHIKGLRRRTGATINIEDDGDEDERRIEIKGTMTQVRLALALCKTRVDTSGS